MPRLQGGRCFYCEDALRGPTDVDHFIPWARYPDNGLDNLEGAKVWIEGATLVGLEKVRVERALAGWG